MKLIKLTKDYYKQLLEMMDEWCKYNNDNKETNNSPYSIFKNDYHDFDNYLDKLEIQEATNGLVPDSTFFLYDEEKDMFVGAVNIRYYLNESLLKKGGHIGVGIRPSERRKGNATLLIKLALDECKRLGIDKVLVTCNKDNIGSAKSILNNGGKLENEVLDEKGTIIQRYWIELK